MSASNIIQSFVRIFKIHFIRKNNSGFGKSTLLFNVEKSEMTNVVQRIQKKSTTQL